MPSRFTLRQLEYVVAVGEAGSIAQAAQRLHLSAPSLSAAIAQLEASFGLPLFVRRHAHALTPTAAGRQVLAAARDLLARTEALATLASDLAGQVAGPLAVGCLATFAPLILPDLRRSFEARFPAARIRQAELDHGDLIARLLRAEIDLGLTYDLMLPPDVAFQPLASLPPWVMLAAGHPLAARPALLPGDLADQPMVLLDLPYSADYFLSLFARTATPPRIAERTTDMSVLRALVANGYGYALVNLRTAVDRAPDGKPLAFVPLAAGLRPLQLGLATMRGGEQRGTVAAFAAHCRATVAATGLPGCLPPA